jgi:hypothetical protein
MTVPPPLALIVAGVRNATERVRIGNVAKLASERTATTAGTVAVAGPLERARAPGLPALLP